MIIKRVLLGAMPTNCYIIKDEKTNAGAVIDPCVCNDRLLKEIKDCDIELKYILLTHGHFDHILGVNKLKEKYPDSKIVIGEKDAVCLYDAKSALCEDNPVFVPIHADILAFDNDKINVGDIEFTVMFTPGHTKGGVCYISKDSIFTGDTLFYKTVGRTDLLGGGYKELMDSLAKIKNLSGNYKVYPGHGEYTDLETERTHNMFMRRIK